MNTEAQDFRIEELAAPEALSSSPNIDVIIFYILKSMKRSIKNQRYHLRRKKVSLDLPDSLYEEAESIMREQHITMSALFRQALERYLAELKQRKLERELEEGYLANATVAEQTMRDFACIDAESF